MRERDEENELRAMFDAAWEGLSPEEREAELREREAWLGERADDEGTSPSEGDGLTEALAEAEASKVSALKDLKRELGL